jgi:hypothetical protein
MSKVPEGIVGRLAHALKSYDANACQGNHALALFSDPCESAYPVRLELEGEAIERIASAFERIATALERK